MSTQAPLKVRLDANGEPDVRFYLAQAHAMRGQAIRDGCVAMSRWVRGLLNHPAPHLPTTLAHH